MNKKSALILVLGLGAIAMSGCYESSEKEPGMYKGAKDPLLNQQASSREEALQKRFELVQLDR